MKKFIPFFIILVLSISAVFAEGGQEVDNRIISQMNIYLLENSDFL